MVLDPWRTFWVDSLSFNLNKTITYGTKEIQATLSLVALGMDVPGHRQQQLMQTLTVCFDENAFVFMLSKIWKPQASPGPDFPSSLIMTFIENLELK